MNLKELLQSLLKKDILSNTDFNIFLESLNKFNISSNLKKEILSCFTDLNWLFIGIDFNALESRIDALTTKDPNKLKVFTEGWDSHCYNAIIYFPHLMPDIDPNDVNSVNSIKDKYPHLRQNSKQFSFGLQYGIEPSGIHRNTGTPMEDALRIYENYHKAYVKSLEWKENKIKQAYKDGYITTGFGLRVRAPFLKGKPYTRNRKGLEGAEARTVGNALGQGWGVLNDRLMNSLLETVDKEGLSLDILPVNKIHDASYYLIKNDVSLLVWFNKEVVKESYWNDHPDIYHPEVGLGGQLDIFYPDWSTPLTLPEDCTEEQLIELAAEHKKSLSTD